MGLIIEEIFIVCLDILRDLLVIINHYENISCYCLCVCVCVQMKRATWMFMIEVCSTTVS